MTTPASGPSGGSVPGGVPGGGPGIPNATGAVPRTGSVAPGAAGVPAGAAGAGHTGAVPRRTSTTGPAGTRSTARPAGSPPRAARRTATSSQGSSRAGSRPTRPPRLASLQLRRIDPWTALKIGLIVSIVMFFVWMIAVGVLYLSLEALGVWDRINETYNTLIVSGESVDIQPDLITPGTLFGVTAIVGAVNIVLFTALSAVVAFVYNAAAGMAGGVELTLGERD